MCQGIQTNNLNYFNLTNMERLDVHSKKKIRDFLLSFLNKIPRTLKCFLVFQL